MILFDATDDRLGVGAADDDVLDVVSALGVVVGVVGAVGVIDAKVTEDFFFLVEAERIVKRKRARVGKGFFSICLMIGCSVLNSFVYLIVSSHLP